MKTIGKSIIAGMLLLLVAFNGGAQEQLAYKTLENVPYYEQPTDDYQRSQCAMDIYHPDTKARKPIVVWFHGGGLTGGRKEIPAYLKEKGMVVVGVGYRFSPGAKVDEIIRDAAKAVAFVHRHAHRYNGDPDKLFVAGHSAGGYLATMIGLNPDYLETYGMNPGQIAGIISLSGQAITHFTARKEQGIAENRPIIDRLSPLYWVRKDAPPIVLLTGDREKELLGRYEENAYLKRMLDIVGHPDTKLLEFQGYGHNMTYPGFPVMLDEIKRILSSDE